MFKRTKKDLNEITKVSDIADKFGKYQILQYFYASLPAIFVSMINVNYIFVAGEVGYRCRVPECDSSETNYSVSWWPNHTDQCTKPLLNLTYLDNGTCTNNSFTGTMEQCTDWVYENHNTIISKLNLACQPLKRTMVGLIHNIGMTFAELVSGWTADIYGRKITMIICAIGCVIGNFKTLASNYNVYVTLEFLEALICGGVNTVGSVLMIEIAGNNNRILAGMIFAYAIYMGEALFALIGWAVPYWKTLIYIICAPTILFIFYFKLMDETLRWLVLKGKLTQAKITIKKMVKENKLNTDMEELNTMNNEKLKALYNLSETETKEGMKQVYQCKKLFIWFLAASFCRFTVSFVYYGLLINSVVLPGNKYTNFLLAAVMSFPGEFLSMITMSKIGRKLPLIVGFLLCGISCIASGYVPDNLVWLKICLFLIGKLVTSACNTGIVIYSMELFPTSVRGSLIGLCTVASSLGSMIAPLTPLLSPLVASLLFGFAAVISSALLILPPETKELPLMDTIEQVVESIKAAKDKKKSSKGKDNLGYKEDEITNNV